MRRKMEKNKQEIPRLFQLWDQILNGIEEENERKEERKR